jgi:hypothetical protein
LFGVKENIKQVALRAGRMQEDYDKFKEIGDIIFLHIVKK